MKVAVLLNEEAETNEPFLAKQRLNYVFTDCNL